VQEVFFSEAPDKLNETINSGIMKFIAGKKKKSYMTKRNPAGQRPFSFFFS